MGTLEAAFTQKGLILKLECIRITSIWEALEPLRALSVTQHNKGGRNLRVLLRRADIYNNLMINLYI